MTEIATSGAQALVQSLGANGVDTLFGLPGVQLDHVFEALYQNRQSIRVINSRHEQGCAYMAYGYAEATGKLGAFLVVPGPGLLNTATAICTAHASNAPVLALTGQIATRFLGRGLGVLHELRDAPGMLAPITKKAVFAERAAAVPSRINEAIASALTPRQGPVLFEIPVDVTTECDEVSAPVSAVLPREPEPDIKLIERAAQWLESAAKPALFVGGGAFGAEKEIAEIARLLEAPVIMTRHGRGALSDHDYHAQTLMGGHLLWHEVDVVIAVGTRFLESLSWGVEGLRTIRVDADTEQADKPQPPDLKIVGSAKKVLAAIRAALDAGKKRASRESEFRAVKKQALEKLAVLEPQKKYSDAIRAALPEEGIVVADITQIGFYGWMGYPVYGPRTVIYPGYQDSLGYGFATSLGVKVARPDRPVVALCGDGGFMFTMPELATAVQHGINVVAVVFNDGGFGNVRRTQKNQFEGHYLASDLRNPDFGALAKAFGAAAFRAESPEALQRVLPAALAAGAPALIEVPVGPMPAWQPLMPSARVRGGSPDSRT